MSAEEPTFLDSASERLGAMNWVSVAKKDFQDAIRSMGLWLLAVVFTVFFVAPPAGALYFGLEIGRGQQELSTQLLYQFAYTNIVSLLIPIVAIFVGYAAITKERESGSVKLLLSLPHSRKDVIVGKVLGRCAVVGVAFSIALAITAVFLAVSDLVLDFQQFLTFGLFSMLFTLVVVAVAVSISGAMPSSLFSLIANATFYFFISFVWNSLANSVADTLVSTLGLAATTSFNIVLFLKLLNPSQAYKTLTNSLVSGSEEAARSARYGMFSGNSSEMAAVCGDVLRGNATTVQTVFGNQTQCNPASTSLPIQFSDPAVLVYLLLWIVVAAAISYYTFDRADL